MDLCSPMRIESINGKKYVLVIVDDYSRYTWTYFLRSKDETPNVLINFLRLIQRGLHAQVRTVRTDKGTEFLNKTLHEYFSQKGIEHQTSVARTPEQNDVAEAIATACFTQNRSLVIPRREKTPYHIINGRKPYVKFFHIFGSLCYIVKDGENLDKMKENVMHVFLWDHVSSDPAPQCQTTTLEHNSLSPNPQSEANIPLADKTVTTSLNELDMLFSLMFDEYFNGASLIVSKSSTIPIVDASDM
ncbi:retrovirus-related pol polyprotein from transposon TNT 1-94 [Tanacetum coccineum]